MRRQLGWHRPYEPFSGLMLLAGRQTEIGGVRIREQTSSGPGTDWARRGSFGLRRPQISR
jgi:hypothetical protein